MGKGVTRARKLNRVRRRCQHAARYSLNLLRYARATRIDWRAYYRVPGEIESQC